MHIFLSFIVTLSLFCFLMIVFAHKEIKNLWKRICIEEEEAVERMRTREEGLRDNDTRQETIQDVIQQRETTEDSVLFLMERTMDERIQMMDILFVDEKEKREQEGKVDWKREGF